MRKLFYGELKKGKFLQFDESPVEVLKCNETETRKEYWEDRKYRSKEDAEGHERKCYTWLVRGGLEHPVHSYNSRWTRSGKNVIPFLEGFNRNVIQSDGYAETESDWEKLLAWNIEITPFQIRGEWMDLANHV